jgi:hypothetical protein
MATKREQHSPRISHNLSYWVAILKFSRSQSKLLLRKAIVIV